MTYVLKVYFAAILAGIVLIFIFGYRHFQEINKSALYTDTIKDTLQKALDDAKFDTSVISFAKKHDLKENFIHHKTTFISKDSDINLEVSVDELDFYAYSASVTHSLIWNKKANEQQVFYDYFKDSIISPTCRYRIGIRQTGW